MKRVLRHGPNVKEQPCQFCGDPAEHSVTLADHDPDYPDEPAADEGPVDLCETCVLRAEKQARERPEGDDWDHAERGPGWVDSDWPDCPWCEGTGQVAHDPCCGSGCNRCLDGEVTCGRCGGSGQRNDAGDHDEYD